jgi:hypothetical protein
MNEKSEASLLKKQILAWNPYLTIDQGLWIDV